MGNPKRIGDVMAELFGVDPRTGDTDLTKSIVEHFRQHWHE